MEFICISKRKDKFVTTNFFKTKNDTYLILKCLNISTIVYIYFIYNRSLKFNVPGVVAVVMGGDQYIVGRDLQTEPVVGLRSA